MRMGPIERRIQNRGTSQPLTFLLLALLFGLGAVFARPARALAFRMEPLVAVDIETVKQVDLQREYSDGYVVVIGGRPTCPNTRNVVGQALELSKTAHGERCRFVVVDCDSKPDAFKAGFGASVTDRVRFYTSTTEARDGVSPISQWLWRQYRGCGGDSPNLTLPFVFLLDHGDYLKYANGRIDLSEFAKGALDSDGPAADNEPKGPLDVYRLYNPYTGEHLFTTDVNERIELSSPRNGWTYEGTAWTAPAADAEPVYRLFNRWTGEHLFTKVANEYATLVEYGWSGEGVKLYSRSESGTPVYRLFNPYERNGTSHHYTTNRNELRTLVEMGWRNEGVCMRGL